MRLILPGDNDQAEQGKKSLQRPGPKQVPFATGFGQPVLNSRIEERANQPEHTLVVNPFRQMGHKPVMLDSVKNYSWQGPRCSREPTQYFLKSRLGSILELQSRLVAFEERPQLRRVGKQSIPLFE
jgi:hypothetical protein